jgi:hypothetical protein
MTGKRHVFVKFIIGISRRNGMGSLPSRRDHQRRDDEDIHLMAVGRAGREK